MQNSHDVVNSLLHNKPAERVGLWDHIWDDTVKKFVAQGMPTDDHGNPVDAPTHFEWDMHRLEHWAIEMLDWKPKIGVQEIIEENDEWKIVRDGCGSLTKWWKKKSGTQEHIDFTMTSRTIWENEYRPYLLENARDRLNIKMSAEALTKWKANGFWTYHLHQFIWENLRQSMGDLTMYMALAEESDWIHDFNRVYTDLYKECFGILFKESGKPDGIWITDDLGYKGRLFCSPKTLEELFFPYYSELVEFFNAHDVPVVFHSCGYQETILDMIVQAGFVALNPMEVAAGNDLLKYAETYGDKLVFIGGMDKRIIESGDRAAIKNDVKRIINGMKECGARYIFGSDHSISTEVDYEDYMYTLDVYRECMTY